MYVNVSNERTNKGASKGHSFIQVGESYIDYNCERNFNDIWNKCLYLGNIGKNKPIHQ